MVSPALEEGKHMFHLDTVEFGVHDAGVIGVPLHIPWVVDSRLALLRGTKVYIPSGILAVVYSHFVDGLKTMTVTESARRVCKMASQGSRIAQAGASLDWRRMDVEKVIMLAKSAGVKLADSEADLIFDMIGLSQHGEKFVPDWNACMLSELPCFEKLVAMTELKPATDLKGDLENFATAAELNIALAFLTRITRIASGFSSASDARDMPKREAVLDRLAALFGVIATAKRVAELALVSEIMATPLLDETINVRLSSSQFDRLKARVARVAQLGSSRYADVVRDSLIRETTHMKRPTKVMQLPFGVWYKYFTLENGDRGQVDHLGYLYKVDDIGPKDLTLPGIAPIAMPMNRNWTGMLQDLFDELHAEIEPRLSLTDPDPDVTYAIRMEGEGVRPYVRDAVALLEPSGIPAADFPVAANQDLKPITTDSLMADDDVEVSGDLVRTAFVPAIIAAHDARDPARILRGRTLTLSERIRNLIVGDRPGYLQGNPSSVIYFRCSPIYTQWPRTGVSAPIWEMFPAGYAGSSQAANTKPANAKGLADMLDFSEGRMHERFEGLLHGRDSANIADILAYAWRYIGLVLKRDPKAEADRKKWEQKTIDALRKSGSPLASSLPSRLGAYAKEMVWKSAGESAIKRRFERLAELIPLDASSHYFLAVYTALPVPGPIMDQHLTLTKHAGVADPMQVPNDRLQPFVTTSGNLIDNEGITRLPDEDNRTLIPVSVPAGRYCGSNVLLTLKTVISGEVPKYSPLRYEAVDALVWSDEELLSAARPMSLIPRPAAKPTTTVPAILTDDALVAEEGMEF